MLMKEHFTHYGWFFMCPIYLNANEGDGMAVEARHWMLEPWFTVNELIFAACVWIMTSINPEYEPMFPFRVTGEIK
jgi:hypothetical protein